MQKITLSTASIFVVEGLFICIYFLLFEENHQNRISRAGEKILNSQKDKLQAVEKEFASNVEHCLKKSCVSSIMFFFLKLYALFTFEEGKIKISNVSLLYCHCYFVLSLSKRFFCIEIFSWDLQKVSVVRSSPLRTVCYLEVSL